jgi:hypothetical protein
MTVEMEKLNIRLGTWSQRLAPGYSWCFRCETPWLFVPNHTTDYRPDKGCFALCEKCWQELTPQQRLPYYRQLWEHWNQSGLSEAEEWQEIEMAVLEGR